MTGPYEDILEFPHHVSSRRKKMSLADRAAQFAPFAALSGFEAILEEAKQQAGKDRKHNGDGSDIFPPY